MTNAAPLPPRSAKNQPPPPRPPRKGSLSRHDDLMNENGNVTLIYCVKKKPLYIFILVLNIEGKLNRSSSELNFNAYNHQNGDNQDMNKDDKKKRGRSPFR